MGSRASPFSSHMQWFVLLTIGIILYLHSRSRWEDDLAPNHAHVHAWSDSEGHGYLTTTFSGEIQGDGFISW